MGQVRRWPAVLWRWEARFKGVVFEGAADLVGRPMISRAADAEIVLGPGVRLNSSPRANPLGCFQACTLRALLPGARLVLGRGVGASATVFCAARSIEIGEGSIFGAGAMVIDNDFHIPDGAWGWSDKVESAAQTARAVKIGRGVFVGARAIVLKGVTIGDRAIIGAGAVVSCNVPPGHLAVGNPARIIEPESK